MSDNEENNSQEEIQEENPEESPASQEEVDDNDATENVGDLNGSPRERASSLAKRRMSSPNVKEGFQTTEGEEGDDIGEEEDEDTIVLKVGMIGDSAIGKTSLMVKYVEHTFDEDYVSTLGNDNICLPTITDVEYFNFILKIFMTTSILITAITYCPVTYRTNYYKNTRCQFPRESRGS